MSLRSAIGLTFANGVLRAVQLASRDKLRNKVPIVKLSRLKIALGEQLLRFAGGAADNLPGSQP